MSATISMYVADVNGHELDKAKTLNVSTNNLKMILDTARVHSQYLKYLNRSEHYVPFISIKSNDRNRLVSQRKYRSLPCNAF